MSAAAARLSIASLQVHHSAELERLQGMVVQALKHQLPPAPPLENEETARVRTVLGLIELRKAGVIKAVYCDAGRLHVIYPGSDIRILTRWDLAAKAVQAFHAELAKRKPAMNVVAGRRKSANG
jgi:hypothetical protein